MSADQPIKVRKKHPTVKPDGRAIAALYAAVKAPKGWTRTGVVLHEGRQCAWIVRHQGKKREDQFIPLS